MAGYIGSKVVSVSTDAADITGNITVGGTVDGRDIATDGTKLDGVEASATADQTNAEIRAAVEAASDSNVFTDADHTKLNAIEAGATADQTKSDIEGLGIDLPVNNLTGTIAAARLETATTQAESDDSTKIATTAYVTDKITTLIGGAPSTLNDLNELAAAINDDANYNSTLTTALATKVPLAGGTMTGALTATKLTSSDGVLELDDNGSHNGIINAPASLFINIDSDNGATGEDFVIAKDRTSTSGGTELFRVQEDGKVGIGTSAPSRQLSLTHTSQADISLLSGSDSNGGLIYHNAGEQKLLIANRESDGHIAFQAGGTTERMRISSTGDVIATSGSLNLVGTNTQMFASSNGDDIQFKFSGTKKASINNGGLISASDGSAVVPAFRFVDDPNTGMYRATTDTIAFSTASTERMRISNTGALTSSVSGGYFETRADGGGFNYKQTLDTTTAGLSITGQSNRGDLGQVRILQASQGADGGYIELRTSPNGSTSPALAMKVDSSGSVKIGPDAQDIQLSPASTNSGVNQVYLRGNASNDKSKLTLNHYGVRSFEVGAGIIGSGLFHIGTSDSNAGLVMDGSSNVLIGKTALDNSTVGARLNATGDASFVSDGTRPLVLNRKSSDGEMVIFLKDNTTVGSINSRSGVVSTLILDPRANGVGLAASTNQLFPSNGGGSIGIASATVDLGGGSDYPFRDLYLSGGIQFDARSNKLSDYEEGTWTPSVTTASSTTVYSAYYTKIGKTVLIQAYISWANNQNNNSNQFRINGLPFVIGGNSNSYHSIPICYWGAANMNDAPAFITHGNSQYLYLHKNDGTNVAASNSSITNSSFTTCIFSGSYQTN